MKKEIDAYMKKEIDAYMKKEIDAYMKKEIKKGIILSIILPLSVFDITEYSIHTKEIDNAYEICHYLELAIKDFRACVDNGEAFK